ncbi:MAG: orotate phosphoribosyltransferase, partial [Candidatus Bathyarchaeia archaeon]
FPDVFHRVIDLYKRLIKEKVMEYDRIAGVPTAGIPFASVIAYDLHKPFLYIRKEAKTHGRERLVEGYLAPGDKVLIVDDLATTGKSSAEAVEAVRKEGGVVTDLVVLVDRLEGASSRMDEANIRLHSVITIKDLADHLYDSGVITRDQLDEILRQTRS